MYDFSRIDKDYLRRTALQKWSSQDPRILPLSVADLDFRPPQFIREALHQAVEQDNSAYHDSRGIPALREILSEKLQNQNHLPARPDQVLVTPGTLSAIALCCRVLLRSGDEAVVCPSPVYAPLFLHAIQAGADVRHCPWKPSALEENRVLLSGLITSRTKMLIVCNPHNPTGHILTRPELEILSELAIRHNLWILSDELYEDLCYHQSVQSIASLDPDVARRTISLFGVSKAFAIPGYRAAYLYAPEEVYSRLLKAFSLQMAHCDTLSQAALSACIREGSTWLNELRAHLQQMQSYLSSGLNTLPGIQCTCPPATPFLFPDIRDTGLSSDDLTTQLHHEAGIIVQSGTQFGPLGEGFIRINYATNREVLEEVLQRMQTLMPQLKKK